MTEEHRTLMKLRIRQAWEDLAVAKKICDGESPSRAVVNRLYYACFYAVCALLAVRGMDESKHSGVRSQFSQHFVHTGEFETGLAKFFNRLFDARLQCDYEQRDVEIPRDTLSDWLVSAELFIQSVDDYLKNHNEEN